MKRDTNGRVMGKTSFVVAPHRSPKRGETLVPGRVRQQVDSRITGHDGALWLRDNRSGRLTFIRACFCGKKHYPK